MRRRTVCGVTGAALLLAALPGGAAASSGEAAPTASHPVAVSAGKDGQLPQATGCKGSDGTRTGTALTSQEFTDLGGFSEGADDFRCSGSRKARTLRDLTWLGSWYAGSGPADSFNVRVYRNDTSGSIDEPGKIQCEFLHQGYTEDWEGFITFKTTLKGQKCVLKKNLTYWLSIQAVMSFGAAGQWGWETVEETNGNGADWLDSGLFGTECTSWANDLTWDDCAWPVGDFIFSFK